MIQAVDGPGLANADDIADAEKFADYLNANGVTATAVHSRLPTHRRTAIMDDLKAGKIKCAVHVNLLTEGANYPWLMWLTLRREVESRVRFCQEAGRGLRAHAGQIWGKFYKDECVFNDPHDLFGGFGGISFAEALGEAAPKEELPFDVTRPAEAVRSINDPDPPVAMAAIESAVRTIAVACMTAGMMGDRRPIKKADRLKPSNALQQVTLGHVLNTTKQFIPTGWFVCLLAIRERPDCVRFGFASDLISALSGIRQAGRWPDVDAQGRISGVIGESPAPAPEEDIKIRTDDDGQNVIDFEEYCDLARADSLQAWVR